MLWELDPGSQVGLAEQIAGAVRRAVVSGELTAGEPLPTSAELAAVLGVNRNTVLAAYRRLREEEIVEFRRGRGARIREDVGDDRRIVQAAREFLRIGSDLGYSAAQLSGLLHRAAGS